MPQIRQGNTWRSPIDADGNFVLDGNKHIDIPPGTYYLNDFILTGQSTVGISADTTIYLTGSLNTAGGAILNSSQDANNLTILMTGGTALLTANVEFYGVVYAPNTTVEIAGGADVYGAIVGRTLSITGTGDAHYDESLDLSELDVPRRRSLVD